MKNFDVIGQLYLQDYKGVVSVAEKRHLPQGYSASPHCHESIEIYVMVQGECIIAVNKELFTVHTGQLAIIFSHMIHSLRVQAETGATFLHILLRTEAFRHIDPKIVPHLKFISFINNPNNSFAYRDYSPSLLACAERICMEMGNSSETYHIALANLYMDELVFLLSRDLAQSFRSAFCIENSLAVAALQFINVNLYGPITVQMVVDSCQVSARHLANVFKKHIGLTVLDYINIAKVDKAMELLHGTDFNILQLATKLGFSSGQYFSTVFKRYAGMTPSEYRVLRNE